MPSYNTSFDLDIEDLEIIETALHARKKELSLQRLNRLSEDETTRAADAELEEIEEQIIAMHHLLGRLHNQKIFYRPKTVRNTPYIGG